MTENKSRLVAAEIFAERQRQKDIEGWRESHDDHHEGGEMALAAVCYATPDEHRNAIGRESPDEWPWDAQWWKPKSARQDLIRAAALIVAEIERLDRAPADTTGANK